MADQTLTGGASFTEVIEVGINSGAGSEFDKGLKQMLAGYKQFLAELKSEAATNGVNPQQLLGMDSGGASAFAGVLADLRTVIAGLRNDIREAFSLDTSNITEAADKSTAALEKTAAAAKDVAQQLELLPTPKDGALFDIGSPAPSDVSGGTTTDITAERTKAEKLALTQLAAEAEDQRREQKASDDERKKALIEVAAKKEDELRTAREEMAVRKTGLQQLAAQAEDIARIQAASDAERKTGLQQLAADAEDQRRAAKAEAAERKTGLQQLAAQAEDERRAQQAQAQTMKRTDQERLALLHDQAIEMDKTFVPKNADFFTKMGFEIKGILSDLPQAIAHVTKFFILWTAITKIAEAFAAIARDIVNEFKQGFDDLTKDEQTEDDLRAILMQSVEFADKNATGAERIAQNYERAGIAAKILRDHLEHISVDSGLDKKTVTGSFQSFVNAGGAQLTGGDLNKAADVTGLLDMAVKLNNNLVQTRTLTSQIQAFTRGDAESAKTLLTTLGLTVPQAKAIVEQARTQGDLYEQLQDKLDGVNERLLVQATTMKGAEDAFAKNRKDLDETIAKPIFDEYKKILIEVSAWMDKNKVALGAIGQSLGGLVASLMDLGANFLKPVFEALMGLGPVFVLVIEMLNTAIGLVSDILGVFFKMGELINALAAARSWADMKKAVGDFYDYLETRNKRFEEQGKESRDRIIKSLTNKGDGTPATPAVTGFINKPDPKQTADHEVSVLTAKYKAGVAQIKQIEDDYRNGLAEAVANHTMSVAEATQKTIASVDSERQAVQRLTTDYEESVNATGAKVQQKQKAIEGATTQVTQLDRALDNIVKKTNIGLSKDQLAQMQEAAKAQADLAKAKATQNLADAQYAHSQGGLDNAGLARAEAEAHNANFQALMNEAYAKLAAAGANERAKQIAQDQINLLNDQWQAQQKVDQRNNQDGQIQDHLNDLKAKAVEAATAETNAAARLQAAQDHGVLSAKDLLALKKQEAEARLKAAQATLAEAEAALKLANARKVNDPAGVAQAEADLASANIGVNQARTNARNVETGDFAQGLKSILGTDSIEEAFKSLGNTVQSVNNLMKSFSGVVGNIIQGFAKGGVGGGLSALGQTFGNKDFMSGVSGIFKSLGAGGIASGLAAAAGPIGAALSIGGAVASLIGGLFTKAAQKIGQTIAKEMQGTMDKYAQQQLTLGETIQQLEQERTQAIQQLSGKKGGQDQLDKLLPQFDQQIAQLTQQRDQLSETFMNQLIALQEGGGNSNSEFAQWTNTWAGILKQTQDFLNAWKGDPRFNIIQQQANQYLQLQLQSQRIDLQNQYNDGEQQAIQDAISLNDLLTQRNQLEKNYAKQKFDILAGDALERRVNTAASTAAQLADLKTQYDQQKQQLDDQINLTTAKVALEREVFSIASDTATLQQESNALTLDSLNQQVSKYQQIAALLASTASLQPYNGAFLGTQPLDGIASAIPGLGSVNYTAPTVVVYTPNVPADPTAFAGTVQSILDRNARRGLPRSPGRFLE